MKKLIVLLIVLLFMFTLVPARQTGMEYEYMIAKQETRYQSLQPAPYMGGMRAGSIVKVYCIDEICFMTDLTTFVQKKYLAPISCEMSIDRSHLDCGTIE